jgi:hypothetical protein
MTEHYIFTERLPLVPGIEIVAMRERDGGRTDEFLVRQAIHRTGGVTEQAVDAHAVLFEAR